MNKYTYLKKSNRDFSEGRKYIGASDIPTLMMLNLPRNTPMDFYRIWKGLNEGFSGNRFTDSGNFLEPMILGKAYVLPRYGMTAMIDYITSRLWGEDVFKCTYKGVKVELHSFTEFHASINPRFVAHPDMIDLTDPDSPVNVQAKNTGEYAAGQRKKNMNKGYDKTDLSEQGIPLSVFVQEQWEMMCSEIPESFVAVCIGGNDWKCYGPIKYDKERSDTYVATAVKMLECIDNDIPPTPAVWRDVVALHPDLKPESVRRVDGDDELNVRRIRAELSEIDRKMKALKEDKEDRVNSIGLYIGENKYLMDQVGEVLASAYEKTGSYRVSYSKLKEYPVLLKQCEKYGLISQSESSRLLSINGTAQGPINKWTMIIIDGDKRKKVRKKYTSSEKKQMTSFAKSCGIKIEWERYR